ncbi:SusD-like starch-binding protein associating with outer membrane [Chitinophaga niastensis]|uniref:SusD-like starch-binding protein associating with outer membrane n=1 Tax=Chitinophaga niastensis TaxID=536980 RepID=A0A2P8H9K3_CHINA|nr:SusD/RagB family nutrient-binding outer membrane lipoprotein [Chitinophaga niastensis]PSL42860.1 SusD-like starch-binding protein associating with outer membrane [Chitinophaga niastensis]
MKKILNRYTVTCLLLLLTADSCTKNFGDINSSPSVVNKPDVKFLLSYVEDKIITYQGTEWVWESMEQLMRFTQHVTSSPYEITNNVNTRYNTYYLDILPNLFEIRRQADLMPAKEQYQKVKMVTYILQVMHGIKVTDMNGSIPYSQAIEGRYDSKYSPVYDQQQPLFDNWLSQLNDAIKTLSNASVTNQVDYGKSDIFYQSDWIKWVKLANTLKLRIAARLENTDKTKCQAIFQQVLQDATGPIDGDAAQVKYMNLYTPFGNSGDIDYRSRRYATTSIMQFLKNSNDPRLPIYFQQNDLVGSYKDTLAKYNVSLPAFIDPNDPLISYQGGPADWTTNPTVAAYISNSLIVSQYTKYFLISAINRRFFSPKLNQATGNFLDVSVTYAETCFYIAEFIQKGYAGAVDTKGTAADWYKKGITSSIQTMNTIAIAAGSTTGFTGTGETEINNYLNNPVVKFNGVNDLERIYIQQYLGLYRQPNEAYVFCRRTGYPKTGSAYYARETFNELIPRRFWLTDPGEVNRTNWMAAMQQQGFTPNAQDITTLSSQRVWYDKAAPDFGKGN